MHQECYSISVFVTYNNQQLTTHQNVTAAEIRDLGLWTPEQYARILLDELVEDPLKIQSLRIMVN